MIYLRCILACFALSLFIGCGFGGTCYHNGNLYIVGQEFKDECNTCTCTILGGAACTVMACASESETKNRKEKNRSEQKDQYEKTEEQDTTSNKELENHEIQSRTTR